jgi:hypothetical protein
MTTTRPHTVSGTPGLVAIDALGPAGEYRTRHREIITDTAGVAVAELSIVPPLYVTRTISAQRRARPLPVPQREAALAQTVEILVINGRTPLGLFPVASTTSLRNRLQFRDLITHAGDHDNRDFRALPEEVAPLLFTESDAVFLLPTPQFRAANLRRRYADPARARANWDDLTPADVLPARLERDRLWDEEVRRQAHLHGLKVITTDGHQSIDQLAEQIARLFRLNPPAQHHGS